MIFIDLENKLPTDTNIPKWTPWTQQRWDDWLAKSKQLVSELAKLDAEGKHKERNDLIDANSGHWGELKPWLEALSGGKCWFSDVRELYSHYDVEHFRPKKEAKQSDGEVKDGYWWLAFDYMNFRLCANVGNRKKGGWFPLRAESPRATYANSCVDSEETYFLDPIKLSDVNLVGYDEEGKLIAWPSASAWDAMRVDETAKRLKLNEHVNLAEERRKICQQLKRLAEKYEEATARQAVGPDPAAKQKAEDVARQIRKMIDPNEELSSVARCFLSLQNNSTLIRFIAH